MNKMGNIICILERCVSNYKSNRCDKFKDIAKTFNEAMEEVKSEVVSIEDILATFTGIILLNSTISYEDVKDLTIDELKTYRSDVNELYKIINDIMTDGLKTIDDLIVKKRLEKKPKNINDMSKEELIAYIKKIGISNKIID